MRSKLVAISVAGAMVAGSAAFAQNPYSRQFPPPKTDAPVPDAGPTDRKETSPPTDPESAACRKDLECWAQRHQGHAELYCKPYIERLGKYAHKWNKAWYEILIFSHFKWRNEQRGEVSYVGDKIEFQNGFGAFLRHVYVCDFDPAGKRVIDAKAYPGRL